MDFQDASPTPDDTTTVWRDQTRRYRRPLGGWWWGALIGVPAVLALGAALTAGSGPSATATTPIATVSTSAAAGASPTATVTSPAGAASVSLQRSGDTVTFAGTFPDEASKQKALDALKASLGSGITVTDQATVSAGAAGLGADAATALGGALKQVPDLSVKADAGTVTVSGTADTEAAATAATAAISSAFPAATISGTIAAKGGSGGTAGAGCDTLSADVAKLAGDSQIRFGYGAASVSGAGQKVIANVAALVTKCPTAKVVVTGYADGKGSGGGNKHVAQARAVVVKADLRSLGVKNDITTAGRVQSSSNDAERAANRRVEITIA